MKKVKNSVWWDYLEESHQDLLEQSELLLEREKKLGTNAFHDYAFIVFPAAKAYEGVLKKIFRDMGLINSRQYNGDHFRIGRALNPNLPLRYRYGWVYDKLAQMCGGYRLPDFLWSTWKESRNLLFHWFPGHQNFVTLKEAEEKYKLILTAIDHAFENCKVKI